MEDELKASGVALTDDAVEPALGDTETGQADSPTDEPKEMTATADPVTGVAESIPEVEKDVTSSPPESSQAVTPSDSQSQEMGNLDKEEGAGVILEVSDGHTGDTLSVETEGDSAKLISPSDVDETTAEIK